MSVAEAAVKDLTAIVRAKDMKRLDDFVTTRLYRAIDPVSNGVGKLVSLQIDEARRQHTSSEASFEAARYGMLASVIAGFLALALSLWIVMVQVSKPLTALTAAMRELASGVFSVVLPGLGRKDEIGGIAGAVEQFKIKLEEKMRLDAEQEREIARREQAAQNERARQEAEAAQMVAKVVNALGDGLERLAQGDLTYRVTDEFAQEYRKIQDDFNAAIGQLQETIKRIALSNSELSNAASEITSSTSDLSQRTEEQAASLEETSASMEQIAATVKKNAENAQHANQLTQDTQQVADRGGAVVAQAVTAMAAIEESSRKISDIISVIDEIARQTNLLALNAAVEAARAGEAGRGFAVVASEVRSLAQRSSQAAKDIKDLITSSSGQVHEGVDLVNKTGQSLTEIVQSIKNVTTIVAEIANASVEQAAGVDQINKALNQMDEVTQQNSALVEENAATAKTLENQQSMMSEQVGFFRFDNDGHRMSQAAQPAVVALRSEPKTAPAQKTTRADRGPVGRMRSNLATALKAEIEWKEF
jgi:methyl-accepting chemotaxis protein